MFDQASKAFVHGDLKLSQDQAEQGYQRFRASNQQWAWKFRVLEAKAALWRGLFADALKLLSPPPPVGQPEAAIPALAFAGVANVHLRNFAEAERTLAGASRLCDASLSPGCGEVLLARGLLASEQGRPAVAAQFYLSAQSFAQSHHDPFLESTALLNLGADSLSPGHYDEAIEQSEKAYQLAKALDARIVEQMTQGNIGWAYYKLGDATKALDLFLGAEKTAGERGDLVDQGNWLTNAGYVYMDAHDFPRAEQAFQRAMTLEQQVGSKEYIYNAWRVLARLALQKGDLEEARRDAGHAIDIARESGNRPDEIYPMLVQGQVAARRGDAGGAESTFRAVERDPSCPVFLKWEAEHSLAQLYEVAKRSDDAGREYRAALATFEAAREGVRHLDLQLSFLTNGVRIYDDYVHFLVGRGNPDEALRWADYSRARTLADGLGLLAKRTPDGDQPGPPPLKAQQAARQTKSTLLFYWLGEKQSYLWAITAQKAQLFPLPPQTEIEAAVQSYRRALGGPQDVLSPPDADGLALYRMLVAPAQSLLPADARVFVIPDGGLNNLNFETLIVPGSAPHYWIDDATIANASSLRLLAASYTPHKAQARRLLLVGDSVAPSKEYPELPRAAAQMESVARHFTARQILSRGQATPSAYLTSSLEQFSYIHFVAHGTASRLSPLDSSIVLSRETAGSDAFKLYARDVIKHPLHADLVTISACYGAGERSYSGEGLVGLSWAFLRAGAHNVIAALWEATDVSTEQLMGTFYDELDKGASPDDALRSAKRSLLHGSSFHNPFYWAPFQLYAGS